jgi:hypothetical protein
MINKNKWLQNTDCSDQAYNALCRCAAADFSSNVKYLALWPIETRQVVKCFKLCED